MPKKLYRVPKMRFVSRNNDLATKLAIWGYEKIWQADGDRIAQVFYDLTGLRFWYKRITSIIVLSPTSNAGSRYRRMKLSAYEYDYRPQLLVHELGHRLLYGNYLGALGKTHRFWDHYKLYLFLYDALVRLYGQDLTDAHFARSRKCGGPAYALAMDKVFALTFEQRQQKLRKMISRVPKKYIS